jgi:hypothetical protein
MIRHPASGWQRSAGMCRLVLFAELDLRLQPALGLLEALDKEGTGQR